jgi:hypothetical protein
LGSREDGLSQLVTARVPLNAVRSEVPAAGKANSRIDVREKIDAVQENGRRPSETQALGILGRLNPLSHHDKIVVFICEIKEIPLSCQPARAAVEILQSQDHGFTVPAQ